MENDKQLKWASLHCHSEMGSLLDAFGKTKDIAKRCKELGHVAAALTDHGSIAGCVSHYNECKKVGVKPILGCEFYYSKDASIRDMTNRELSHVVILSKNITGWNELIQCISESNKAENFYFKPRIDRKIMKRFLGNGNHVCIFGHPGTELSNSLFPDTLCYRAKTVDQARTNLYPDWKKRATAIIEDHLEIFGENLFIEIQLLDQVNLPVSAVIAECLREIVKDSNGKLNPVGTADSHYVYKHEAEFQRILLCSTLGKTMPAIERDLAQGKDVPLGTFFISDNYHIPSIEELIPIHTEEELNNAVRIADMCEDYDILGPPILPKFDCPGGIDEFEHLTQLCRKGWKELLVDGGVLKDEQTKQIYLDRIKKELGVIKDANLSGYFLIVQDIINFCKSQKQLTGIGRGSACGSLISYLMGITGADPISYGLIFERFYSTGRFIPNRIIFEEFEYK